MEKLIFKFPHLSERIFDNLNDHKLADCMKVTISWGNYLREQRFVQARIIKKTVKKICANEGAWMEILEKADTNTTMELGLSLDLFRKGSKLAHHFRLTPLHAVAYAGNFALFQNILEKSELKNPKTDSGMTPHHYAAQQGHLEIFEMIVERNGDIGKPNFKFKTSPLDVNHQTEA